MFVVRLAADFRFDGRVPVLHRLLDAFRRCCRSLPDQRRGRNPTYDMADFGMAAFAPFFLQSPSFLAHQRDLETTQGRSNCQTLFGMRQIPGDSQIRAKLEPIEPALFHPMFADVVAELDQCGGLDARRCLDAHVLIALDGTEFPARTRSIARTVPTASAARTRPTISTPCSPPRLSHPDITGLGRWRRNSSCPRTGTTNRTAKAVQTGAGWRRMALGMPGSTQST